MTYMTYIIYIAYYEGTLCFAPPGSAPQFIWYDNYTLLYRDRYHRFATLRSMMFSNCL